MITGVLVPGAAYPTQAPLLDLADAVLADRQCAVEHITWAVPSGLLQIGPEPFVRAHVTAGLHRVQEAEPRGSVVVIAKSLGSYAAALVAERGLPAVWLTPVLTDESIVESITASPAPALLIGGSADQLWVRAAAEATGKQTLTIPGADHSLRVPGPVRHYAEVLGAVGTAMEQFFDTLLGTSAPSPPRHW
ncbi:alpha/beta hydrolase [Actinoplanes auranticolor]|uniref:alpha/beta hydrolase n=1 Tax=Actinoplanes auranticolor TaxID=47988 RepID=UPI001BB3DBC3|nr:alpha/beta hydrolase [Actinoplanes auranticolor]